MVLTLPETANLGLSQGEQPLHEVLAPGEVNHEAFRQLVDGLEGLALQAPEVVAAAEGTRNEKDTGTADKGWRKR